MTELLPVRGLPLIHPHRRWSDRLLVLCAIIMSMSNSRALIDRFELARDAMNRLYPSRRRVGVGYNTFIDTLARHGSRLIGIITATLREALIERSGQQGLSLASALRVVRRILIHQARRWMNVARQLWQARTYDYERRSSKIKRHWPKRSRKHDCKTPVARIANHIFNNV